MTRRDFQELALIIKTLPRVPYSALPEYDAVYVDELATRIADFCADRNARFDRARFLKACGVKS